MTLVIPDGEKLFSVILPEELLFLAEFQAVRDRAEAKLNGLINSVMKSGYIPSYLVEDISQEITRISLLNFKLGQMYADRSWTT